MKSLHKNCSLYQKTCRLFSSGLPLAALCGTMSLSLAPGLWGQQLPLNPRVLYEIQGEFPGEHFGTGVWGLEDVDGDGLRDFLAIDYPSEISVRRAEVYSGADGRYLHSLDYDFPSGSILAAFNTQFGQLGDLDGDGVNDFIAGDDAWRRNGGESFATIFRGRTGEIIRTHRSGERFFGYGTYGLGDLDEDGSTDYAIETGHSFSGGAIEAHTIAIHSGATGAELATLTSWAYIQGQSPGRAAFIGIEDVNGDGRADFAVLDTGGRAIWFVSGAVRGRMALDDLPPEWVLGRYDSPHPLGGWYRAPIFNVGDLDGDGFDEVVAVVLDSQGGYNVGLVAVSSRTAEEVWSRILTRHKLGGNSFDSVARISDLSGDGVPELVTGYREIDGTGETARNGVAILSGADGREVFFFSPTIDRFPRDIRSLSDLDGDGIEEIAMADYYWNEGTGRVLVYSIGPGRRELELSVAAAPSGMVIVSWTEETSEVVLERSEDLIDWEEVTMADPDAKEFAVSPPAGPAKLFFRLRAR